ncbi:MAG: lysylphosphatidylglycerol synthase transmembrane domain-containing protein [Chloroflexota bacterium]
MRDEQAAVHNGSTGNGDAAPMSLEKRFFDIRTLVSFGVAFAILYFVFSKMDLNVADIVRNIATANPLLYLLALVTYYSTFLVRSLRWKILLKNVGFGESNSDRLPSTAGMAEIIFLSWFANCIMPAKLGDAYRAYLLKRSSDVSFSKTFGTILAERIVDLLLTFVLLAVTGLVAFHGTLPPIILVGMQASLGLVVAVIVGLLAMRNLGSLIRRFLPSRLHRYYGSFEEGTLHSFRQMPLVLAYSLLAWAFEAGRLYFVVLSLGLAGVSFPVILFTAIAGSLLTSLPGTPAGLGFVESVIIGILLISSNLGLISGVDEGLATSVAILDRTISYWSLVIFGLVAYILTKKK